MDKNDPNTLYYGSHKLYKTTNGGDYWTAVSGDLTNGPGPGSLTYGTITTIDVSATSPDVIVVGTDDANVWVTQNGGDSWNNVSATLPDRWVTRVVLDPFDESIAYVTLSGYKESNHLPHIFRTTNFGQDWTPIDGNLPDAPINDVVVDPSLDQTLYIGTDFGPFYTTDMGLTWQSLGTGIPLAPIHDLDFHSPTRKLVAGTHGRSMYSISLQCAGDDSDGDGFADVCDNCPGAFNSEQEDYDNDIIGDSCDNCIYFANPDQEDSDGDETGDSCDICPYHIADDCCNPSDDNSPPSITSGSEITVLPGGTFDYTATTIDLDCDGTELTLGIQDYPSWCIVEGNTITGSAECDHADTVFKVIVSDGDLADTLEVALLIDTSNQAPEILDQPDTVAVRSQESFAYYPTILDPDDSTHLISYPHVPNWCTIQNDSVIGVAPDTQFTEMLTVVVQDYCGADTLSFMVAVYVCGDANSSSEVDIDDVVYLINYIFSGGLPPDPIESGDANCAGGVDIDDVVWLIAYIFSGGNAPCDTDGDAVSDC
jgi:hypothetical protein